MLLEHPAVADAGVFARPDAEWGERVVATVVLRDGPARPARQSFRRSLRERLARFKVPKEIGFSDELPRTVSGKLLRRRARLKRMSDEDVQDERDRLLDGWE